MRLSEQARRFERESTQHSVRDAYIHLLDEHQDELTRHCRALCSGEPAILAQDLMQETMLKAFSQFERYDERGSFKAWVLRIATHTFISMKRKAQVRRALSLHLIPELVLEAGRKRRENQFDSQDSLRRAFRVLSNREKVALVLFHVSGFSIDEIRDIQRDTSLSATKSRLSRARKKLKTEIERLEAWQVLPSHVATTMKR